MDLIHVNWISIFHLLYYNYFKKKIPGHVGKEVRNLGIDFTKINLKFDLPVFENLRLRVTTKLSVWR